MSEREELEALRRMAELEAKASGAPVRAAPSPDMNAYLDQKQARDEGVTSGLQDFLINPKRALLEGAGKIGTSIVAKPVSEVAGLAALAKDYLAGNKDGDPAGFRDYVRQKLTYEPRNAGGNFVVAANPLNAVGAGINALTKGAAGLVSDDPSSAAYQGTQEALNQAVGIAGARSTPVSRLPSAAAQKVADAMTGTVNMVRPKAIAAKKLTDLAGENRDLIAQSLGRGTEYVPGSKVTAQEAIAQGNLESPQAHGAGLVKLQQDLARVPGYTQDTLATIERGQEAARRGAIGGVAQTPAALEAAKTKRAATADPLYKKARESVGGVDTRKAFDMIDDTMNRNIGNERLVSELGAVRKSLKAAGGDAEKVASVLDSLKERLANQDNKFIKGHLAAVKDRLTKDIPGMEVANAAFAKGSEPVNQMAVGQMLERKLTGPRGEERAGQFATAVREAPTTIKRSTGQDRFQDLSQVLTPEQMKVVNALGKDLEREAMVTRMARETSAPGDTAPQIPQLPMMLNPAVSIANKAARHVFGDLNQKANKVATDILADPAKLREVMTRPKSDATRKVVEALMRGGQMSAPYYQENQ